MIEFVRQLIDWVGAHPQWAGAVIAAAAFGESLAFVGLIVPGVAVMFAAGALIAGGVLDFWPVFGWAVAGAILGDGVSFVLGRHYRERVGTLWPFRRYPQLLRRGRDFFERHGGKSVVLGRFIGPVRPVVPVVAGMLAMPPLRFYIINVLSALGWAPAYLLPGMAFGASLVLAGAVAGRLALLVAGLVLAGWLLAFVVRRLYRLGSARAGRWTAAAVRWARGHPQASWLFGDLLDPERPPGRALVVWLALLMGGGWLFGTILESVLTLDRLVQADQAFYDLFRSMRGPLGDRIMVVLSALGDSTVVTAVAVFVVLWLVWRRAWRDLFYWLAATAFGLLAVALLKLSLQVPRPVDLYQGLHAYSFPSSHATMSMVVYGFAAVLCTDELALRWRALTYSVAALLITGIAVSRLYLGAHWLSDVAGGLALGLTWVALLAIARRRHVHPTLGPGLAAGVALVLVAAGAWHAGVNLKADLSRYAERHPVQEMDLAAWQAGGWRRLPAWRIDLEGEFEQPLNVQWAGPLDAIRATLLARGWRQPVTLDWHTILRYLLPSPEAGRLPVLPQLHDGRQEALLLVRDISAADGKLLVLHLWPTDTRLAPQRIPLWVGTLGWLDLRRLPLLALPVTTLDGDSPVGRSGLADTTLCSVQRRDPAIGGQAVGPGRFGSVLMCRAALPTMTSGGQEPPPE